MRGYHFLVSWQAEREREHSPYWCFRSVVPCRVRLLMLIGSGWMGGHQSCVHLMFILDDGGPLYKTRITELCFLSKPVHYRTVIAPWGHATYRLPFSHTRDFPMLRLQEGCERSSSVLIYLSTWTKTFQLQVWSSWTYHPQATWTDFSHFPTVISLLVLLHRLPHCNNVIRTPDCRAKVREKVGDWTLPNNQTLNHGCDLRIMRKLLMDTGCFWATGEHECDGIMWGIVLTGFI